ncbi:hypothetical protein [Gudongella oleilytica]|nr:hypothetical protein [Gudongella oleilytica]
MISRNPDSRKYSLIAYTFYRMGRKTKGFNFTEACNGDVEYVKKSVHQGQ